MRKYYACILKGNEPMAIDTVFSFDFFSMRKQWLSENENPVGERVILKADIAKKHEDIVEVTFQQARYADGGVGWVWFYDGFPE
jgi:hypothetical protein